MHLHAHQHLRAASAALTHPRTHGGTHSATPRANVGLSQLQPLRWRPATHVGCSTDIASQRHWPPRRSLLYQCPFCIFWGPQDVRKGTGTPQRTLATRLVQWPSRGPGIPEGTPAAPTSAFIRPAASAGETGTHWASERIKRALYTPSSTTSRTTMSFKPTSLHAITMARSCGAQPFARAHARTFGLEVCHG